MKYISSLSGNNRETTKYEVPITIISHGGPENTHTITSRESKVNASCCQWMFKKTINVNAVDCLKVTSVLKNCIEKSQLINDNLLTNLLIILVT